MEVGTIKEIMDNKAVISMIRKSACSDCHACEMSQDKKEMTMTAINECNGKVGDSVMVELVVDRLMFATFILYGVPLITTVIGFVIGFFVFKSEVTSFLLGIFFMLITYFIIKKCEGFFNNDKYIPVARKIVEWFLNIPNMYKILPFTTSKLTIFYFVGII